MLKLLASLLFLSLPVLAETVQPFVAIGLADESQLSYSQHSISTSTGIEVSDLKFHSSIKGTYYFSGKENIGGHSVGLDTVFLVRTIGPFFLGGGIQAGHLSTPLYTKSNTTGHVNIEADVSTLRLKAAWLFPIKDQNGLGGLLLSMSHDINRRIRVSVYEGTWQFRASPGTQNDYPIIRRNTYGISASVLFN